MWAPVPLLTFTRVLAPVFWRVACGSATVPASLRSRCDARKGLGRQANGRRRRRTEGHQGLGCVVGSCEISRAPGRRLQRRGKKEEKGGLGLKGCTGRRPPAGLPARPQFGTQRSRRPRRPHSCRCVVQRSNCGDKPSVPRDDGSVMTEARGIVVVEPLSSDVPWGVDFSALSNGRLEYFGNDTGRPRRPCAIGAAGPVQGVGA